MSLSSHVSVVNESTVVSDAAVQAAVTALQYQATAHFGPRWHTGAILDFVPKGSPIPPGHWWLAILDDSDQAGALGYHDLTSAGLPLGKVFAKTDQQFGMSWTVTASHELLEMLGDPWIDLTVFDQTTNTAGMLYAYEACDACEADQYGYLVSGILVSDFVTPAWFDPTAPGPYDYKGHITAALELLPGGYIGEFDVTSGSGWKQRTAEGAPEPVAPPGSRRERRARGRKNWKRSEWR